MNDTRSGSSATLTPLMDQVTPCRLAKSLVLRPGLATSAKRTIAPTISFLCSSEARHGRAVWSDRGEGAALVRQAHGGRPKGSTRSRGWRVLSAHLRLAPSVRVASDHERAVCMGGATTALPLARRTAGCRPCGTPSSTRRPFRLLSRMGLLYGLMARYAQPHRRQKRAQAPLPLGLSHSQVAPPLSRPRADASRPLRSSP